MNETIGGDLPPGHDALLFSISGTGSFICPAPQSRLDIPRRLIVDLYNHGPFPGRCLGYMLIVHIATAKGEFV